MNRIFLLIFAISFFSATLSQGQVQTIEKGLQAITPDALEAQLGFLASDWMEGRKAGEKGAYLAADYIASMLKLYGVKPFGDYLSESSFTKHASKNERSFFQNFILIKTNADEKQVFRVISGKGNSETSMDFAYNVDFVLHTSLIGKEINAPVVFAGYGYKNDKLKYNDFSNLDVRGKFILKIAGIPEFIENSLSPSQIALSIKEMHAELLEMGVAGIIEFDPEKTVVGYPEIRDFMDMSPSENNPRPAEPYTKYSLPSINVSDNPVRIAVSAKAANAILKGSNISINDYIKSANKNDPYLIRQITDKSVFLKSTVITKQVPVRNIIGIIEGRNPDEIIVLGAHYDHMGMTNGYIWNGADDNGSGSVGIMTLAKAIIETGKKPEKTIIIALWTAEEVGLLGSRYFIQNPPCLLKNIKLNVNFDMISRYVSENEPKNVTFTYTSSLDGLKELTRSNMQKYDIDLVVDYQPSADPPGGSDHRSFVAAGIPVMRFKAGHREEYHTPHDEPGTINQDIFEKIIKLSFANIWEMANNTW